MIVVEFRDIADVARLIDGLLEAATAAEPTAPMVARAYTDLSNRVADALDALPAPSGFRAQVELARARRAESRSTT
ncbi:hypothetical protein INN71_02575 [Nocardioides sp. ChNu-153]|uniref:hypothetical protein n=1 Tax=unclassified Nocardioides TaxID=2615069 RepID=UPI0024049862|nr:MULTISPECIES: hypothetical protein [unclassified Nocardioides]MDF9717627.1 hypothetical protein [Nocardioides sp. ChNu-99]MDN7120270.1 hypothetical protein [Nocardioides sp. ChNu-153]